jgi:hypothetical protein
VNLREIEWGGMDWIDLAQDRDQWRAAVNNNSNSSGNDKQRKFENRISSYDIQVNTYRGLADYTSPVSESSGLAM